MVNGRLLLGLLALTVTVSAAVLAASSQSLPSAADSTSPPGYADDELQELQSSLKIRTKADSFVQIVAATKPTFSWDDCYLMWVHDEPGKQVSFELSRAWFYQPFQTKPQCLLFAPGPDLRDGLYAALGQNHGAFFVPTTIISGAPREAGSDASLAGNCTRELARDKDHGVVYEICWESEMGTGTGHPITDMMLYVSKDPAGKWHFIGEGPPISSDGGGSQSFSTPTAQVAWNKDSPAGASILFTIEETESYPDCDPAVSIPVRDEYQDAVLDGNSPQTHYSTNHYLLAKPGETLDQLVQRCVAWDYQWQIRPASDHAKIEDFWRKLILRLNPDLKSDSTIEGSVTKIFLPTDDEITALEDTQLPSQKTLTRAP